MTLASLFVQKDNGSFQPTEKEDLERRSAEYRPKDTVPPLLLDASLT